jgi:diacylglycerol O-acyltransferase
MSLADAAWLGLDRPEHLMVVTVVLRLERSVDLDHLRELVSDRIVAVYPTFRQRPVRSRFPLVPPAWRADPDFAVAHHVTHTALVAGAGEGELMDHVGELMSRPLDLTHAPWQLTVVDLADGGALIARLHHCLADGIALAGVLLSLVDDAGGSRPDDRTVPVVPTAPVARAAPITGGSHRGRRLVGAVARTMGSVLVGRADPPSRLRGPASVGRRAAWTSPLDLADVKDAAKRLEVSVNDILLAAVAGGLRTLLLDHQAEPTNLRVMVPVDLRRGSDPDNEERGRLGNRFGIVFVRLPVAASSATERVAAVRAATAAAKRSAVAPASYGLLNLVGLMPRWGQGFAADLLGRIATGIVTNVPGPRTPLTLAGAPLQSVVFWVPHIGPIGIGVSIFSYAGTVTLGVATNDSLELDPLELVDAIEAELALLGRLSSG